MKQKRFNPGTPTHNYQKSKDGNLLFYSLFDRLVYFTIYCIEAKRRGVMVLSLNLMFTHTHALLQTQSRAVQSHFNREVERLYAREFNGYSGHRGPVFMKTYGWAQKRNNAKVRSCLAYIGNNHVEKKLCRHGIEERWSLLAYAFSDHPFSEALVIRRASVQMKKAVRMVKAIHERGHFLNYTMLARLFGPLEKKERNQLIDFIIIRYSVIDYDLARKHFLITPDKEKERLFSDLLHATKASRRQVSKLLQIPVAPLTKVQKYHFLPPPFFINDYYSDK